MRRLVRAALALAALTAALLGARPAFADPDAVHTAADALRSQRLYVDPEAGTLSGADVVRVREALKSADPPVFLAVLPADAAPVDQLDALPVRIHKQVGRSGTYAVLVGRNLDAASDRLPEGRANKIAREMAARHHGDIPGGLVDFVRTVRREARHGGTSGSSGSTLFVLLLLAALAYGPFALVRRVRAGRRAAAQLAQVRRAVEEDLSAFGEDLEHTVAGAPLVPAMRADADVARSTYELATQLMGWARRPADVHAVTSQLEKGRYALACLQARREGRPLPKHRAPCLFDPRHGPST